MDPEEFDCTIITTYPGSPYFDESVKQGEYYTYTSDITGDKLYQSNIDYLSDIDYYKGDPNGGYISYVWTDYLKPNELAIARGELEKDIRKKLEIKYDEGGLFVNTATSGVDFSSSNWYHVAVTYDGSNDMNIFINGVHAGRTEVGFYRPDLRRSGKSVDGYCGFRWLHPAPLKEGDQVTVSLHANASVLVGGSDLVVGTS